MSESFADKVVFLTGGAGGMGRKIAETFAATGAKIIVTDRAVDMGRDFVRNLEANGGIAHFFELNVSDKSAMFDTVRQGAALYGGIDIVVHCAAEVPHGNVLECSDEHLEMGLTSIIKSAFWITQATHPWLCKARDGGRMIFITSINGPNIVIPGRAAYAVAKTGLDAFIRAAALDLARDGITVNGIVPGLIATDRAQMAAGGMANLEAYAQSIPVPRPGKPEEIAHLVQSLASKNAGYITGERIVIDGGSILTTANSTALIRDLNR